MSGGTLERYSRTIPASGVIETMRNNVFILITSSAPISIRLENGGAAEGASGLQGGIKFERVKPWDNARIVGAAGTTVEFYVGSYAVDRDLTEPITQIATIAGVASVAMVPSSTLASQAKTALATGNSADIPANLARKRISITCWSDSAGTFCVRDQAATTDAGTEVQAGVTMQFDTTAALRIRNNSGSSVNYSWNEEA